MFKDTLAARREITATSRLHLHPDCKIITISQSRADIAFPGGRFRICFAGAGTVTAEESFYCCEFGKKIPNKAIAFTTQGRDMQFACCIARGDSELQLDLSSGATVNGKRYGW